MNEIRVKVTEEDNDKLMAATMIVNSLKDVVVNVLTIPDIQISIEKFKSYIDDYVDKYLYAEFLKNEIAKKYIDNDKIVYSWNIDFNTQTMSIVYKD